MTQSIMSCGVRDADYHPDYHPEDAATGSLLALSCSKALVISLGAVGLKCISGFGSHQPRAKEDKLLPGVGRWLATCASKVPTSFAAVSVAAARSGSVKRHEGETETDCAGPQAPRPA